MSTKPTRKCRSCGGSLAEDAVECSACGVESAPDEAPSNPFALSGDTRPLPDPISPEPAPAPDPDSDSDPDPDPADTPSEFEPESEPETEVKEIDPEPQEGELGYSPHRGDTVRISVADAVAAWNEDGPEPNEPPPPVPDDVPEIKVPNIKLRMIGMVLVIAGLIALALVLMN